MGVFLNSIPTDRTCTVYGLGLSEKARVTPVTGRNDTPLPRLGRNAFVLYNTDVHLVLQRQQTQQQTSSVKYNCNQPWLTILLHYITIVTQSACLANDKQYDYNAHTHDIHILRNV